MIKLIPGKKYVPKDLFERYSKEDLEKVGLTLWKDGRAVAINTDQEDFKILSPINHPLVFQNPNWYIPNYNLEN